MQLIKRIEAAQATIDRFLNKEFEWGSNDCAHLAAFAIRSLGHPDPLANVATYATRRNAIKAMRKAGITSFGEHLESLGYEPIAPALAMPGDLVGLPAEEEDVAKGWVTLGVAVGQNRFLAFSEGKCILGAVLGTELVGTTAWRVPPAAGAF
jgi:hypothetical protein